MVSDTYKVNKLLLCLIRTTKKNWLYEIGHDKKVLFIKKLTNIKQEYNLDTVDISKIEDAVLFNQQDVLFNELKKLNTIIKAKLNIEDRLFVMEQIEHSIDQCLEHFEMDKKK